jgi:phage terminase large subunit
MGFAQMNAPHDLAFVDEILGMYDDPYRFVLFAFDFGHGELSAWEGPDKWQRAFLLRLKQAIKDRKPGEVIRMAVKTGKGPGKTCLEAWLILWLMSTRPHFAGFATANTAAQLSDKLWREVALWHNRLINKDWFTWTAQRFYHKEAKETWGIDALPWREHNPDALGGLHNGGRGQAAIVDEGSGVPAPIYDVIDSTMTDEDSFEFVFGNPYRKSGRFYELFTRFAHRWITFTVDCRDAKAPNQSIIAQSIEDYGLDSDYIRVNVLGEFPQQDAQTLIPQHLIEAAYTREVHGNDDYRPVWGLDVARFGDDRTVLARRRHRDLEDVASWRGLDTMQTAGRVKAAYDECATDDKPTSIVVDVIGIGAGVVDRLRELDLPVRALNVSELPAVRSKFHRLRDELYWRGREWFEGMNVRCDNREVGGELADVLYTYTSSGQIKVEPKADIKERLGRSPDVGEAFLLSLMEDCQRIDRSSEDRYSRARNRANPSAWAA